MIPTQKICIKKEVAFKNRSSGRWTGVAKLTASVILIAFIWIAILPMFSRMPMVREKMDAYQRAGIDPYAVFYSDHPGMRDIEQRMDSIVNGRDNSFWQLPKRVFDAGLR